MKHEFEERIGETVTAEAYDIIERVYTYHPALECSYPKDMIAKLWKVGGLALMRDMLPRANVVMDLESEIQGLEARVVSLRDKLNDIKMGAEV